MLRVLRAHAQEERPDPEQSHQGQRHNDVVAAPTAPESYGYDAEKGEDADAEESAGADQRSSCRARESALRNGVGGKCRAPQDDEEANGASHHGHHGGFDPRVDHETREQPVQHFLALARNRRPLAAGTACAAPTRC